MQKQLTGYTLDSEGHELIFDRELFENDIKESGLVGYETTQLFDNGSISKYKNIVITGSNLDRIDFVKDVYNIEPSELRNIENDVHAVFSFTGYLTTTRYAQAGRYLSDIFQGDYQAHTFFGGSCEVTTLEGKVIQDSTIRSVFDFNLIADTINEPEEVVFNMEQIEAVAKKLKYEGKVDHVLNIAPGIGEPFNLAVNCLGSIRAAMIWCNKYWKTKFIIDSAEVSQYIVDGVAIKGSNAIEHQGGYKMDTDKGQTKITDFLIKVHYQMIKSDGESVYIVSIVPQNGKIVNHIEWKNVSSDGNLADFLMRFGSFHIGGGKAGVKCLHEMITGTTVPVIKSYVQYGIADYKGQEIMICKDAVLDMNTKQVFLKNEKFGFYFIGGNDGIVISSTSEAGAVQPEHIPKIASSSDNKYDDYAKIFRSMYKNSTADILLLYACSMAGVSLYHEGNKTPSYYVTGVTGTGKSSFAEALYSMFGIEAAYGLRNSTAYPVKILLSAFNRLPVFLNEFRSDMKYASDKLGFIQMAYDNSTTSKGLRNGGTISYKMTSQVFCEGEDTYDEGSIRTRSILHTLTRSGTTTGCIPKNVITENKAMLESFFGTYAKNTSKIEYRKHLKETQGLFYRRGVEPRISDNISSMYAGAMAFSPENKDLIVKLCNELIDAQMQDYQENGESQKMLKILAEYYGNRFCKVYVDLGYLYIDWVEITTYIDRYKRNLTLSVNAYMGHMEALGFEKGFFEIEATSDEYNDKRSQHIMINGFRAPLAEVPKNILNNPRIYSEYRRALTSLQNAKN